MSKVNWSAKNFQAVLNKRANMMYYHRANRSSGMTLSECRRITWKKMADEMRSDLSKELNEVTKRIDAIDAKYAWEQRYILIRCGRLLENKEVVS